jgi:molybdate transport system substrate-binding protein
MKWILTSLAALWISGVPPSSAGEIRVSAAASLGDAMAEIADAYQRTSSETIRLNFGGSNALARQIKAGAPCDVFISADEATLKKLMADGLLHENSVARLLGNSLVVITPADSPLKIASARDLVSPRIKRLSLGDPAAVPAGVYARKWLESQQTWEAVSGKVVAAENVRTALAAVGSGNADAGVVYRTDVGSSKDVTIAFKVPSAESPEIVYPAAATKSSPDPGKAIRFIHFLKTGRASDIFRKHGFIPLSGAQAP